MTITGRTMTDTGRAAGLLLDTHVALWIADSADRLDVGTRRLLGEPPGPVYISVISVAEIAIKVSIGLLRIPGSPADVIESTGCESLDLRAPHANDVASLPLLHRDPFDRLLISQAITEGLVLVTADRQVLAYPGVRLHRVN